MSGIAINSMYHTQNKFLKQISKTSEILAQRNEELATAEYRSDSAVE
jgi:hypothetical protein